MTKDSINLLMALPPEARPINRHLGLVRDNRHDQYPLYRNDHISLVISGCGTQNAAAATSWLHLINNCRPDDIWINLGIAGHPNHAVGKAFLANSIQDVTTGDNWIMETKCNITLPRERVFTLNKPDTDYNLDGLMEMEAAGFYRTALKCTTADKIYCLKIISDNRDNPADGINGKMVSQLISEHLGILNELIRIESNQ